MSILRPFFCQSAFPNDERLPQTNLQNISAYLEHASGSPTRADEFELAIESVLRNNGFDPRHDICWKVAGIEGGLKSASGTIKQAYLNAVPEFLELLKTNVKSNPYDFTPANLGHNAFHRLVGSFKRAHVEEPDVDLVSDVAWQNVGFLGIVQFQQDVRQMFIDSKVGGHVAYQLNPNSSDTSQVERLSIEAADHLIRYAFPELADALNIPKDIKLGLIPKTQASGTEFRIVSAQPV